MTFTKERLEEIAEDGFLKHGESKDLARIALAGMEAVPAGEFYEDSPGDWYQISQGDRAPNNRRIPLYTAPQPLTTSERAELENYRNAQQVVVKDHQVRELVNELRDIAVEYHGTQQLRERIARTVRAAIQPSISGVCGQVPSPELLCQFVTLNYANYEDAWLCGKSSEILAFLLHMSGHECEKVSCTIGGVGHLYVRCSDLNLDPSIKQFGDYPEISRGAHPCTSMNYVEDSTWSQEYRNAQPDVNYQHLSELYHAQEKRLFKLAKRIKGPEFDKYAHSTSQAIDVLESAVFGESEDASRAAMQSGAVKDGWVMVPVEMSVAMRKAFHKANDECEQFVSPDHQWQAMIAAAPQQDAE